jgi:Tfp pilus assembly protein PilX
MMFLTPKDANGSKRENTNSRGFTILLAALVASLVLSLGISVFTIAQKQLLLSSLSRTSQYAFYAADAGAECALYWDLRHVAFGSTSTDPLTELTCDGQAVEIVAE